jgi:hypothetical protein
MNEMLTDFLRRRLDEDEAVARAATPGPWVHGNRWLIAGAMFDDERCAYCRNGTDAPAWVGRRDINGRTMLAHVHRAEEPWTHGIYSEADPSGPVDVVNDTDEYGYMDDSDAAHIARHDPARVLADVKAKRAIIGDEWSDPGWDVLCALASAYADHPDYREEWS